MPFATAGVSPLVLRGQLEPGDGCGELAGAEPLDHVRRLEDLPAQLHRVVGPPGEELAHGLLGGERFGAFDVHGAGSDRHVSCEKRSSTPHAVPNTGEPLNANRRWRTATNTVYLDVSRPSHLILPVIPSRSTP